jgi:hypothetical protein
MLYICNIINHKIKKIMLQGKAIEKAVEIFNQLNK